MCTNLGNAAGSSLDNRYETQYNKMLEYNKQAMTRTERSEVAEKELPKMYKLISEIKQESKKYEAYALRDDEANKNYRKLINQQWDLGNYVQKYEKALADDDFKRAEKLRKKRREKFNITDRDLYD